MQDVDPRTDGAPGPALSPEQELGGLGKQFYLAQPALALFAAVELGLMTDLDRVGEASAEDLASVRRLDVKGIELLLRCLAAAGVVVAGDDRFRLEERFRGLFSEGSELYEKLSDGARQARFWAQAAHAVSRDRKLADSAARFHRPRAWTAQYLHKVEAQNRFCAESLCFHLRSELRRAGRLVDIGGGHGQFTRAAQTTNPRLAATIVDLPNAIDHCRTRMREEPFPGPVVFEVRDARTFDRPETFDVAIISDLLHYFTGPEKREVVGRALCSLVADGVLAIAKFRLDRGGDGPPAAVFFSMQKYLETPNAAFLETDEECRTILQEAGARDIRVIALSEDKTLVTGRKRG